MPEFWLAGVSESTTSVKIAQQRETEGWDGQMFMDSQSLSADPYVMMGAWAVATERLKLCTSTTNPLTRHPAVTAACAASLQSISGGRAYLGIGRGDSALAYLGYAPAKLSVFRQALQDLQTLLSGGEIAFGSHETLAGSASADTLSLSDRPENTRLKWLPADLPKVPLDVAATGPKVIAMAAAIAERVTFSVGAMPDRLQWAVSTAETARSSLNLSKKNISYGAQIIVVCNPDLDAVLETTASFVAPLARFQVIQSTADGPQSNADSDNLAKIRRGYDMTKHGEVNSLDKLGGASLSEDFVRRFAIVGSPEHCIERLLELYKLGIERFVVVGPGLHPEYDKQSPGLFISEVMPALRQEIKALYP